MEGEEGKYDYGDDDGSSDKDRDPVPQVAAALRPVGTLLGIGGRALPRASLRFALAVHVEGPTGSRRVYVSHRLLAYHALAPRATTAAATSAARAM